MYREQMHFIRQPFQDGVDTAFFYTGGTRQEIVDELISVIAQRVPFITMTGDEGSGKTVICRMLEEKLPPDLLLLLLSSGRESLADLPGGVSGGSFGDESISNDAADTEINLDDLVVPRTLESFDDMVSIIFEQVVGRKSDVAEGTDTESILDDIVKSLRARGKRLLIIFDEAEKIYLAPLERLRRLLDQVNEESVLVQMLFSGRPLLTENFEQLSIVTFKEIEERHFVLQPLDRETTLAYLNHCMEIGTGEKGVYFSREIVDRIFSVAKGNFTKINRLAREYLKAEKLDTKFLKLLDTHKDIGIEPPENRSRRSRVSSGMPTVDLDFLKLPTFKPQWLLYGGIICAIVLLILLLIGRSSDESKPEQDRPDVPVLELKNVEPLETAAVVVPPDRPVGGGSETSVKVEKITVIPPADVPVADSNRKNQPQTTPKEVESAAVTVPKQFKSAAVTTPKEVESAAVTVPKQFKSAAVTIPKEVESAAVTVPKQFKSAAVTTPKEVESAVVTVPKQFKSAAMTTPKEVESATVKAPKEVETVTETKKEEAVLPLVVEPSVRQPVAAVKVEQTAAASRDRPLLN